MGMRGFRFFLPSLIVMAFEGMPIEGWAQKLDDTKTVEISIGRGHPDAKSLHLRPTPDTTSSNAGVYVPKTIVAAISELNSLLPAALLEKILQADGADSDFFDRSSALLETSTWIYRNWQLDDQSSPLGNELRAQGFETPEWMGRALFEMLYQKRVAQSGPGLKRMRRFAFVEKEDGIRPETPPPTSCAAKTVHVQSKDIWLGAANRWPYGRIIYWVDCIDSSKRAYLWEREWFVPDATLQIQLSQ